MNTVAAVPLWIDGKAHPATSTRTAGVTNPATGKVTRQVPLANAQDVDAAVQSAQRAFPGWRDTPPLRRA
ncbi:MAG: aldehyde dehydrogenase family protein, partial [Burkholderiales bacterium]